MTCNVVARKKKGLRKRLKFTVLLSKPDKNNLFLCTVYFRAEEVYACVGKGCLCVCAINRYHICSKNKIVCVCVVKWEFKVKYTLWTLCFQYQPMEAERGLVRPQNRHFLTQKPYGLPFLLVTFFNWTHRFRVIN